MPCSRRSRSRCGSSAARSGGGPVPPCRWWTGPTASPADAGTPDRTSPAVGSGHAPSRLAGWPGSGDGSRGAGVGAPAAIPSPKPSSASCASASSTSSACGPDAVTISESPKRAPSATTFVRLVALTRLPVRTLRHPYVGVEPSDRLDKARGRTRMETNGVADLERRLRVRGGGRWGLADGRLGLHAELRGLHRERPARLGGHLLERRATARRGGGRYRSLDQWRLAQQHRTRGVVQQLDRELGAHQRAPEVHQHEDPVRGHRPLDRSAHALSVGAEYAGLLGAARGFERQVRRRPSPARASRRPEPARRCGTRPRSRPRVRPQSP